MSAPTHEPFRLFQPTITTRGLAKFGLTLQQSRPCAALAGIVHSYLQIKAGRPTPYPILPDGTQSIFISSSGSFISGAQSKTCDIQILEAGEYFGVRFHASALRHFFSADMADFTNELVICDQFPYKAFYKLSQRISEEVYYNSRVNICDSFLLQNVKPVQNQRFDAALQLIYQSPSGINISEIASSVGWSARHLNRSFQLYTGLSTKAFSNVIRIQRACQQLYKTPNSFLDSALSFGFFDQSHFIKEFKKHVLMNPTEFSNYFMSDFYNQ